MSQDKRAAIGIFDSGIGGLTVVKAVMEALPNEDIVYFGDTARVPYGTKSTKTVREFALEVTDFLIRRDVKMILIACNTVAAAAESAIAEYCHRFNIPVLGVIQSGAEAAVVKLGKNRRIAVIGTLSTVGSGAYESVIRDMAPDVEVYSRSCPMLVPLAEEGWYDNEIAKMTVELYLGAIREKAVDALILGCTHYPLFKETIRETLNRPDIEIVDSADTIAAKTAEYLKEYKLLNPGKKGYFTCYVSDKPQRFQHLAELFLGRTITRVEIVSIV